MKAAAIVLLAAACAGSSKTPAAETARPEPKPAPEAKAEAAKPGIDLQGIDRSVKPGDDFFLFANGTWVKNTEIPPDRSSYGTGAVLVELTAKRTADLIAEVSKDPKSEVARKVGDYYASFLDEAAIEQ